MIMFFIVMYLLLWNVFAVLNLNAKKSDSEMVNLEEKNLFSLLGSISWLCF